MEKRKIIMDCDPGVDDAIALAYAAAHPEAFELLAVTSVTGNQTIDKVTRNALDLVSLYRLSIPVARGAETPLLRDPQPASDYHGANGLGNVEIPRSQEDVVEESAVFFMKKLI